MQLNHMKAMENGIYKSTKILLSFFILQFIRVQGSNLRGGMDFQNRWGGPPKF